MEKRGTPDGSEAMASDYDWRAEDWLPEPTSARLFYFDTVKLNSRGEMRLGTVSPSTQFIGHSTRNSSRI
jgi:hypothetical protein